MPVALRIKVRARVMARMVRISAVWDWGRRNLPSRMVWISLARNSMPDMREFSEVGTTYSSWNCLEEVGPMRTILSVKVPGSKSPLTTSTKEMCLYELGGPKKLTKRRP